MMRTKEEVLADLNRDLPINVDWHEGARRYLTEFFKKNPRRAIEHYSLTKPLTEIPPESEEAARTEILHYIFNFANSIQLLRLPRWSRILDVACGGGWTAHWLARLGYAPIGIDISEEFIELARRRIQEDVYLARDVELGRPGSDPKEMFFQHNIEDDPLNVNFARSFHAAIFESCLHHFVDPISALYHVSMALRDDGVILILEGENRNGPIGEPYLSAMLATNTLERPLPRSLLEECLNLAGLPHYEFVGAINGYFSPREPRPSDMNLILETSCSNANLVVCAKTDVALRRVFPALGDRSSADEPGNSDGTTAKGKRDADPLSAVLSRLPQWLTGR